MIWKGNLFEKDTDYFYMQIYDELQERYISHSKPLISFSRKYLGFGDRPSFNIFDSLPKISKSATIPLRNILPYKPENNILIENKINEIKLEDSKSWFLFKKELELSDIKNYFLENFDGYYLCTNKSKIMKKYSDRIQTINLKAILEELDTNIIRLL